MIKVAFLIIIFSCSSILINAQEKSPEWFYQQMPEIDNSIDCASENFNLETEIKLQDLIADIEVIIADLKKEVDMYNEKLFSDLSSSVMSMQDIDEIMLLPESEREQAAMVLEAKDEKINEDMAIRAEQFQHEKQLLEEEALKMFNKEFNKLVELTEIADKAYQVKFDKNQKISLKCSDYSVANVKLCEQEYNETRMELCETTSQPVLEYISQLRENLVRKIEIQKRIQFIEMYSFYNITEDVYNSEYGAFSLLIEYQAIQSYLKEFNTRTVYYLPGSPGNQ